MTTRTSRVLYDMPPAKRHASASTVSSPLSNPPGVPEPPGNPPMIAPAKSPAKAPAKSPVKAPAKSPTKTPVKSPTKTPAKAPAKLPAQAAAKAQTPRKKRARIAVAAFPVPSLRPVRLCNVRAEEVDISVGDDRLSSGDEDDFQVDEGDESDVEGTRESSADDEEENTSNEEDAVDRSAGTPFDQMSKDQLSEHAKTGWATYFEDSCASL
ncbi:hypothetical protein F443_19472 [Phytophthora nicotianae P1569]|uniref:Uncharacterized protein n=1 Tax=Phytophthora nicotianae P1569 TaxID=1317065 RepID=V9E4N9_PHYNI|nr:hypothetical protein F443_19472 [Phytophthora nicotianae P1569]